VPELPEVEAARLLIERSALHRRIVDVDDSDTYECRPHRPGEIRAALLGRQLVDVHRRGKLMWCETSGGAKRTPGPHLAIHLGMAGRVLVSRSGKASKPEWDRFTITFADGGTLRLFDKRRLGRVRLNPDLDALGPDAGEIGLAEFARVVGRGTAPIKARLLDQSVLAGIGNLLADEVLWQAHVDPRRPAGRLGQDELTTLRRELRKAIRSAIRKGGVHTGRMIDSRHRGGSCPRCGAEMARATVGSRTTWWCPREQL
jgi:formamidopyrimidine-DNA glycosylase